MYDKVVRRKPVRIYRLIQHKMYPLFPFPHKTARSCASSIFRAFLLLHLYYMHVARKIFCESPVSNCFFEKWAADTLKESSNLIGRRKRVLIHVLWRFVNVRNLTQLATISTLSPSDNLFRSSQKFLREWKGYTLTLAITARRQQ